MPRSWIVCVRGRHPNIACQPYEKPCRSGVRAEFWLQGEDPSQARLQNRVAITTGQDLHIGRSTSRLLVAFLLAAALLLTYDAKGFSAPRDATHARMMIGTGVAQSHDSRPCSALCTCNSHRHV